MRWADDAPTEPGWYFRRACEGADVFAVRLVVSPHLRLLRVANDEGEATGMYANDWPGEWAGPIPVPE